MDTTNQNLDTKLSAIDKALAAAKARKAMRDATSGQAPVQAPAKKDAKEPKAKDSTSKQAKEIARSLQRAELQKQREERKVAREAARAEKAKERKVNSDKPAHMKKIDKAAAALPSLNEASKATLNELTTNMSRDQLAALALHIQHFNRVQQTKRALALTIEAGDEVRIVSGVPKYIGKTGIVEKAQRIRCFVKVHGATKPVYLFTSDVEPLQSTEGDSAAE